MKVRRLSAAIGLAWCVLAGTSSACLNYEGTNARGERVSPFMLAGVELAEDLRRPNDPQAVASYSHRVIDEARKTPNSENLNDLAVVTIRLGRLPEAIRLLEAIERKYPGRYSTAANLGTALELAGRNRDALTWIRKGMQRNPHGHQGTEWLHARILEAKLEPARIPHDGSSILRLDFGDDLVPVRPRDLPPGNQGTTLPLAGLGVALHRQLSERTDFVGPEEPIVSGLLLDWANLEFAAGTLENAVLLYDLALEYGNPQTSLIARRRAEASRLLGEAGERNKRAGACELCDLDSLFPEIDAPTSR